MKIEKIELNIRNKISAIYFCLNLNYIESSLVLLYSLIDSISWLYSNETNIGKRIVKTDFIKKEIDEKTRYWYVDCIIE